MEPSLQNSFIPKQTMAPPAVSKPAPTKAAERRAEATGLFTLLSFALLFLSVVAAGGTYAYRSYLLNLLYAPCEVTSQLQPNSDVLGLGGSVDKKCGLYASLEDKRRQLDNERLSRMQRLDTKMKLASKVLDSHLSLLPLFDILSTSTLKTLRYTKFNTSSRQVTISGVASSYEDIAVQSEILNKMPAIQNALFSNLDLDKDGRVTFDLNFSVDSSALTYKPLFLNSAAVINSSQATSTR